jgi:hypothetical protein
MISKLLTSLAAALASFALLMGAPISSASAGASHEIHACRTIEIWVYAPPAWVPEAKLSFSTALRTIAPSSFWMQRRTPCWSEVEGRNANRVVLQIFAAAA